MHLLIIKFIIANRPQIKYGKPGELKIDVRDKAAVTEKLRRQAEWEDIRITAHAHQEMAEEDISFEEVREVLLNAAIIENYPDHERGSCCLICGQTSRDRYVHVVCSSSLAVAIIITVYEPKPPKWRTPFERG